MKRRRKRAAVLVVGILLTLSAMTTVVHAAWSVPGTTWNFLTMSSYETKIVEEYEIPESVNPSQEVTKVVNVKNTGTVDTLIRVSVEKMFGTRKEDGSFLEDKTLSPEMIEIDFNQKWWVKKEDGFFYYRDILRAGEITHEPLFSSYRISEKAGNEYRKKDAQIVVKMESVQAKGDAVGLWGKSYQELGIQRPAAQVGLDTSVHYLGKEGGFDITRNRTDLFASFKNLSPGCARTQKIMLYNDSTETVELFLRAEATGQEAMDSQQLQMIRQLLNQYGIIKITGEKGLLYHGPVSGVGESGNNMKHNISLGKIKAGKSRTLTVTLSVSPDMDNRYQELTGKVKWVFTAQGENPSYQWPVSVIMPPKTGDFTEIGIWLALFLVSGGSMITVFGVRSVWERHRRNVKNR